MREWLIGQLAAGLPAFSGSRVAGTVAVHQDVINDLIARWLGGETTGAAPPPIDARTVRAAVKSASVRAEPGRILIDFDIGV